MGPGYLALCRWGNGARVSGIVQVGWSRRREQWKARERRARLYMWGRPSNTHRVALGISRVKGHRHQGIQSLPKKTLPSPFGPKASLQLSGRGQPGLLIGCCLLCWGYASLSHQVSGVPHSLGHYLLSGCIFSQEWLPVLGRHRQKFPRLVRMACWH